jgi:hypothetical protein
LKKNTKKYFDAEDILSEFRVSFAGGQRVSEQTAEVVKNQNPFANSVCHLRVRIWGTKRPPVDWAITAKEWQSRTWEA